MPPIRLLREGEIIEVKDFRHLTPLDPGAGFLPRDFDFVPRPGEVVYPLSGMKVDGRPYAVLIHESCAARVEKMAPWCPSVRKDQDGVITKVYARRRRREADGPGPKYVYMHRFLTNIVDDWALRVDHLNGCTLDNRILKPNRNLIPGSVSENNSNVVRTRTSGIEYRGVEYLASQGEKPFRGSVKINGKQYRTRWYQTACRAAIARDVLIIRLFHGKFFDLYSPRLNFPDVLNRRLRLAVGEHEADFEIPF